MAYGITLMPFNHKKEWRLWQLDKDRRNYAQQNKSKKDKYNLISFTCGIFKKKKGGQIKQTEL